MCDERLPPAFLRLARLLRQRFARKCGVAVVRIPSAVSDDMAHRSMLLLGVLVRRLPKTALITAACFNETSWSHVSRGEGSLLIVCRADEQPWQPDGNVHATTHRIFGRYTVRVRSRTTMMMDDEPVVVTCGNQTAVVSGRTPGVPIVACVSGVPYTWRDPDSTVQVTNPAHWLPILAALVHLHASGYMTTKACHDGTCVSAAEARAHMATLEPAQTKQSTTHKKPKKSKTKKEHRS